MTQPNHNIKVEPFVLPTTICNTSGLPMTVRTPIGVFCASDNCECRREAQAVRDLLQGFGVFCIIDDKEV